MNKAKITGLGHYLPEQVVTNAELAAIMDTTDEWITERTGIKERRFFKEGHDTVASMAARASVKALDMAGIKAEEVDLIIFATLSPDYYFPGSGVLLQRELGLNEIPCLDIRQQCSGFLYGLSVAEAFIKSGVHQNILLVGSEIQSNIMELSDRNRHMAVIFGDGAGAAVIQPSKDETGIMSTHVHAQGEFAEELMQQYPSSSIKGRLPEDLKDASMLPHMNGRVVFKHAVTRFVEVINEALAHNKLEVSNIDLLIPHQANLRISESVGKHLGIEADKVFNNIQKYGNTTAASIPIALSEAVEEGRIKSGDLLCLATFGAGFTWGASLMRW